MDESVLSCEEHLVREDTRQAWVALRRFTRTKRTERRQRTLRGIVSALVDEHLALSRRGVEALRSVRRMQRRRRQKKGVRRRQQQRAGAGASGFGVTVARRSREPSSSSSSTAATMKTTTATPSSLPLSWPRSARHRQMLVGEADAHSSAGRGGVLGQAGVRVRVGVGAGTSRVARSSRGVDGGFPTSPGIGVPHLSLGLGRGGVPPASPLSSLRAERARGPPKLPGRARVNLSS